MLGVVVVAVLAITCVSLFHFSVLRFLSVGMARMRMSAEIRTLAIVLAVMTAHIAEIAIYAVAFWIAAVVLALGQFGGLAVEHPLDYLYFSSVTYTSLGLGDVFPQGHLRFLAGVEALNGLILITWSGSLIYLAMGRLWRWQDCVAPNSVSSR